LSETETNKLKKLVADLKLRGDLNNSTGKLLRQNLICTPTTWSSYTFWKSGPTFM